MNKYDLDKLTYTTERTGVVYNYTDKVNIVLKEYPELSEVYLAKDLFCNKMFKLHEREETKYSISIESSCSSAIASSIALFM